MTEPEWLAAIKADPRWQQVGTFCVRGIAVSRAPHELD